MYPGIFVYFHVFAIPPPSQLLSLMWRIGQLRSKFLLPTRHFPLPFASSFSTIIPPSLHEESAGGLNGRLVRLAHLHSPNDLLSFYSRLGASDRLLLNVDSFNYILGALLRDGQQMEAFRLIGQLENQLPGVPDKCSFHVLMEGLVEADSSGSLALAVDELFELMRNKYKIQADLEAWGLRIRAFLHSKYLNSSAPTLEPARIFYREMLVDYQSTRPASSFNFDAALDELRADLVVTAVNRRVWGFAEWMLTEMSALNFRFDKIANASSLFTDAASIPILRHLIGTGNIPNSHLIDSFGFNRQLLLYCWRQGRISADLALTALKFLLRACPDRAEFWLETAEGCLRRELPRDFYVFEAEETRERMMNTVQRIKCSESTWKQLEQEIINQKLLRL